MVRRQDGGRLDGGSDDELADELDRWIRDDAAREAVVERAYAETLRTETSERTAEQLVAAIAAHL